MSDKIDSKSIPVTRNRMSLCNITGINSTRRNNHSIYSIYLCARAHKYVKQTLIYQTGVTDFYTITAGGCNTTLSAVDR
jgi:hypothetical protein